MVDPRRIDGQSSSFARDVSEFVESRFVGEHPDHGVFQCVAMFGDLILEGRIADRRFDNGGIS